MRKMETLGVVVLLAVLAVLAIPTASANQFYLLPDNSSVANPSDCTEVMLMLNVTTPDVHSGMASIIFDSNCAKATNFVWTGGTCFNVAPTIVIVPGRVTVGFSNQTPGFPPTPSATSCSGPVHLGNITICCNTTSPPCQTDLEFYVGTQTYMSGLWDTSFNPVAFTRDNGTFTCGTPEPEVDLNVTAIYFNLGDTRWNETLRVYVNQSNDVCADVYNDGPDDVADDFDVCFAVDGTEICCVLVDVSTLPGGVLAAGASTMVCCNWTPSCIDYPVMPGYPSQSLPFTINVTADCNCTGCCPNCPDDGSCGRIDETDETNNVNSTYVPAIQPWAGIDRIGGVVNNAYKSRHCDCDLGEDPLSDYWVEYRDLTCGGIEWDVNSPDITLNNGSTDTRVHTIDLPCTTVSVKKAMLFVYWRDYWTNTNTYPSGCLADLSANMSSVCGTSPDEMPVEAAYHDTKGFGKYNSPMGVYIYNVTDWTCANGGDPVDYTVNVTNIDPSNRTKLMGQMLVVIYECVDECAGDSLTHIWIHEGVDYLMAADATHGTYAYHVSPEEATATIPFSGTDTIPDNICEATLTTVVGNGMADGAYALFNDTIVLELNNSDKIAVEEVDVTSNFAVGSTNSMEFMDDHSDGFYAFNVFLVVTEKQSVPTATGLGDASFCVDEGCIENLTALNVSDVCPPCGNPGWAFPYGLFEFNVTCLEPGATVNVTIELPPGPHPLDYMKVNTTDGNCTWYNVPPIVISNGVGGWNVTIMLTDGGLGDNDGVADCQITDPGGPVISAAVQVHVDPCPAYVYPGGNVTVNITLSGITDYGSGTIKLCAETGCNCSATGKVIAVGPGDSGSVTHSPLYGNCVNISASSAGGLNGDVRFATVTLEPIGNPGDCICLNLTVYSLYDTNFAALQTVVDDCCCSGDGLYIIEDNPPFIVSAIADPSTIYNGSCLPLVCPPVTNLTVHVTDATSVEEVWVDLTPLGICGLVKMSGPDGANAGVWHYETCANYTGSYCLDVSAKDLHGNWNNWSCIPLEVKRVGDCNGDNLVNMADYLLIAQYTVGLKPKPCSCCDIVPLANPDGIIDMGDALYIAMYATIPGVAAPGSLCPCPLCPLCP